MKRFFKILVSICLLLAFLSSPLASPWVYSTRASVNASVQTRRINIPYLGVAPPVELFTPSILWYGKVDLTNNYTDVRAYYYDGYLKVVFHIMDRLLWIDTTPSASDLTEWDAVSLYLNLTGNIGNSPGSNAYRLDLQLGNSLAVYQGNGSSWKSISIPITVDTSWRGVGLNTDVDAKGWSGSLIIPFTSLGLSGPPPQGRIWGLGIITHDRDDANGSQILHPMWPEQMQSNIPSTWGQMNFGIPDYTSPENAVGGENIIIRQGLNNAVVKDGEVGGNTMCGEGYYFENWGDVNYAGTTQINIQNQWDIADWPCFSKYFVTFPLNSLPAGKTIISATLTMHLFGGAGGGIWGTPPDSYIQVFSIAEDWNEATLTWNNAPLAKENISGTWVKPMDIPLVWPGVPYTWDVSRAVAEAYATGTPLRLALYSADGERHTGKYFSSSDTGDWNAVARPTLNVTLGDSCNSVGITCYFNYLPNIRKLK